MFMTAYLTRVFIQNWRSLLDAPLDVFGLHGTECHVAERTATSDSRPES
jgi:hypothetical protein